MPNKKLIIGTLIILGIAFSWVISTQISQRIQINKSFSCPFFIIWFSTAWISVCILPPLIKRKKLQQSLIENQLSIKKLFFSGIFFYISWIVANYLYVTALNYINASDVTAIFSSANAFVFIFSIFLLKEKVNYIKSISVLLSIAGIIFIALANTSFQGSAIGVVFTLISAISAAFYKVLLKKFLKDPHLLVTSLFLGFLGIIDIFLAWPIVLILTESKVETLVYEEIPWIFLILGSLASFSFNILINFGIAYTYPLFVSIGTIVGIPLNILVDIIINGEKVGWNQIVGACLIICGFVFLLINNYLMIKKSEKLDEMEKKTNENKETLLEKENLEEKYYKTEESSLNA